MASVVLIAALLLGEGPDFVKLKASYMDALKTSKWREVRSTARAIAATGTRPALGFLNSELKLAAE